MGQIHLIERDGRLTRMGDGEWESGYWSLADKTAKRLNGGAILFHKRKAEPSFFGGTIVGHRVEEDGPFAGRIVFRFRYDPEMRGVSTDRTGWRQEMKLVMPG